MKEPGYRIQTNPTQSATLIPDRSLTYSRRNLDTGYKLIILMEEPGYQIQAESTQGGTSIPDTSWSYSRRNPDTGYKLNLLKEGTWIPDTSWTYSRRNLDTRYKLNLLKVEPEYRIQADPTQGGTRIPDTSWTYSRGEAEYNKIHENLCLELWNWKSWDRRGIIIPIAAMQPTFKEPCSIFIIFCRIKKKLLYRFKSILFHLLSNWVL